LNAKNKAQKSNSKFVFFFIFSLFFVLFIQIRTVVSLLLDGTNLINHLKLQTL